MEHNFETLRTERTADGLLTVTLNRPALRNAISTQMGRELKQVFAPLVSEPHDLRCVLITGAGDQAFCSGADLKERNGMTDDVWRAQHAIFEEAFYALMDCSVPTIAAVNGAAYAGGFELALACDFIYSVRHARFAFTETTLGIIPGVGGTQNLQRAAGERRAKEIILTAKPFSADEAHAWGIVNLLCEPNELMPAAMEAARAICANAPFAVRQAKKAIRYGTNTDLRSGLAFEIESYNRTVVTEDRLEGVRAFAEKRKPNFTGK